MTEFLSKCLFSDCCGALMRDNWKLCNLCRKPCGCHTLDKKHYKLVNNKWENDKKYSDIQK